MGMKVVRKEKGSLRAEGQGSVIESSKALSFAMGYEYRKGLIAYTKPCFPTCSNPHGEICNHNRIGQKMIHHH